MVEEDGGANNTFPDCLPQMDLDGIQEGGQRKIQDHNQPNRKLLKLGVRMLLQLLRGERNYLCLLKEGCISFLERMQVGQEAKQVDQEAKVDLKVIKAFNKN
ncbi:BNR/Asp-box repeat family protein [Striga asiatica]|uniref:BNR/Asp-box repeat family protein n=1 Tax=Striga asiatica TaxID=4170 RepID=A0A5A7R6C4_STRAF|nr:BNR/Asp-box repeat family protein [Striga asiatica]